MGRTFSLKKNKAPLAVILFIAMLTGGHILWLEMFEPKEQPYAKKGLLDVRNWEWDSGRTITLDGEWEFYPEVFLMADDQVHTSPKHTAQYVKVPGDWNTYRHDSSSPYGYGSYRLRILLEPEDHRVYGIYVPNVRSSSQLFVNGRLIRSSGQPAAQAEDYLAKNVPYTASFTSEGNGVVEIVLQAANFDDPRGGGLIRSLKFGLEEAVQHERHVSVSMQLLVACALLFQASCFLVLYIIDRNKRWFYFSLVLFSMTLLITNSSEDKLLQFFFPIDFQWSFKILNLSIVLLLYSWIRFHIGEFPKAWRPKLLLWLRLVCVATGGLTFLLPVTYQIPLRNWTVGLVSPLFALSVVYALKKALQGMSGNQFLFLSFLALLNHLIWWLYLTVKGIKIIFYPFDLIVALITFSSVLFNRYYHLYHEQKKMTAELKEAEKKKEEFLIKTSHELRNPLHGMINISQMVLERERKTLSANSVQELDTVLSIGRRMSLMLDDLLDVAQLRNGRIRLHMQRCSLPSIIQGVMDMVRYMTDGKPIVISNRIPDHFPDVLGDENRIIQIMFNLVHNAIKYTNKGEISIDAHMKDGKAYVTVSDTGIGMDETTVQRIFEPFYRASNGVDGGIGLGLSICKQLVELHGGTIHVQSAPEQGSRLTFSLLLYDPVSIERVPENMETDTAVQAPALLNPSNERNVAIPDRLQGFVQDRPRILIVDDDCINLKILKAILSREKYDVATVTNGEEALAMLDDREWDLIISDVMMPRMSGYELARNIRKRYGMTELPILLLTARSRPEDIENGFLSGANDYVTKPVDPRVLLVRVNALTYLKKSTRERIRMEVAWLQAQIEPHFFFNTLNSIAALHSVDPDQMMELIGHFENFLREKFKFQNADELVPLENECSLVRSYLFIEQVRFGDRLQIHWEIDHPGPWKVPPYTLQPLVENAIKHGIMRRSKGGAIWIRLVHHDGYAVLSVTDNGIGMPEEVIQRLKEPCNDSSFGIGLRNVDYRLRRLYGTGLRFESKPGEGTTVSFVIKRVSECMNLASVV